MRIANISADEQFYTSEDGNETPYWSVNVEIHARKPYRVEPAESWYKRVKHEGYQVRYPDPFNPSELLEPARAVANGMPVTKPVLLAEDGTALPIPENALTVEPVFILFPVFSQVSFSSMGF